MLREIFARRLAAVNEPRDASSGDRHMELLRAQTKQAQGGRYVKDDDANDEYDDNGDSEPSR